MMAPRKRRGQVLILAALTISLTILSTQAYVYRLSKTEVSEDWSTLSDYVLGIEQGCRHVVVASLINVTRGGEVSNLRGNLDRWESLVSSDYRFGRCDLNSTLASNPPYSEGAWLNWVTDGTGISSASANFTIDLSGRGKEVDMDFSVNVTTTLRISGYWEEVSSSNKLITVTMNLKNEGEPALAGDIDVDYQFFIWIDAANSSDYSLQDFGNGTYRGSFTAFHIGETVPLRVQLSDRRQIFVQATYYLEEKQ